MPRKDHLPRQTRQEHITLQPNRSIEFRVTDDFRSEEHTSELQSQR